MSGFSNPVFGAPQGSVIGILRCCVDLLPLGAILKYHGMGYSILCG